MSTTNKADMDKLLDSALRAAVSLLEKNGELYPFAQVLNNKDQIVSIASYDETERPNSQQLLELIEVGLKKSKEFKEYKVIAICLDVKITDPKTQEQTDAIQVNLEHKNQDAIRVYLPYKRLAAGKYDYADLFATKGILKLF